MTKVKKNEEKNDKSDIRKRTKSKSSIVYVLFTLVENGESHHVILHRLEIFSLFFYFQG